MKPPGAGAPLRQRARGRVSSQLGILTALIVAIGVGAPILSIVRSVLGGSAAYTHPLVRETQWATDWLPAWTSARQTIAQLQTGSLHTLMGVLLVLTLLVVALALVNLFTLLLARSAAQRPEMALRSALGARRRQLLRELAREASPVLLIGTLTGVIAAAWLTHVLRASWPVGEAPWPIWPVDGGVIAMLIAAFLLAPLLACLSPASVAWRRDLRRFLSAGTRATAGFGEIFTRRALAVLQIACAVILLTAAAVLVRGFVAPSAAAHDPGFDPANTLAVQLRLPESGPAASLKRKALFENLSPRLAALPGVVDSSLATPGAWLGLGTTDRVTAVCPECVLGLMIKPVSVGPARIHGVSPGFFEALGGRVLRGREIAPTDAADAPKVAVINTVFAARLFPNGEPIGKRIQVGGRDGDWYTVVGIVGEIRGEGIGAGAEPVSTLYLSVLQAPPAVVNLAVRSEGDPAGILPDVSGVIRSLAPAASIADPMTMERYLDSFRAPLRWFALLFAALAGLALLLGSSGLHATMSYDVGRRKREIGTRMALGARRRQIERMILRDTFALIAWGATLGLMAASALLRLLQLRFQGVDPLDPWIFAGTVLLLGAVALAASHAPARRAALLDPQAALRGE